LVNALGIIAGIWLVAGTIVLLDWLARRKDRSSRDRTRDLAADGK
jgi:hypothetical protein